MFTPKKIENALVRLFDLFDAEVMEGLYENYGEEIEDISPRWLAKAFKAKDADVLDAITKEHMAKHLNQEKRPSVLKQLQKLKAVVASIPKKIREKKQERDL